VKCVIAKHCTCPPPAVPEGMRLVTESEFFASIGPDLRNVMPNHSNDFYTNWETVGRVLVGRSFPGWRNPGCGKFYMLTQSARPVAGEPASDGEQGEQKGGA
jgi:hypothetical protein